VNSGGELGPLLCLSANLRLHRIFWDRLVEAAAVLSLTRNRFAGAGRVGPVNAATWILIEVWHDTGTSVAAGEPKHFAIDYGPSSLDLERLALKDELDRARVVVVDRCLARRCFDDR